MSERMGQTDHQGKHRHGEAPPGYSGQHVARELEAMESEPSEMLQAIDADLRKLTEKLPHDRLTIPYERGAQVNWDDEVARDRHQRSASKEYGRHTRSVWLTEPGQPLQRYAFTTYEDDNPEAASVVLVDTPGEDGRLVSHRYAVGAPTERGPRIREDVMDIATGNNYSTWLDAKAEAWLAARLKAIDTEVNEGRFFMDEP